MLELFRDPVWQFVGAVLAVAALLATFVIYQLQRERKGLTYEPVSKTHLLTVREELEGKLQVLYEGEPAKSLTILVLKLWNSGNQPLLAVEYERPISFCLGRDASILSADITVLDPSGVAVELRIVENIISIAPTLLNPGDSITFKLLVRDVGEYVFPDARIAGLKSIQLAGHNARTFQIYATASMLLIAVGFYLLVSEFSKPALKIELTPKQIVGATLAAIGYFTLLYTMLRNKQTRLRIQSLFRGA